MIGQCKKCTKLDLCLQDNTQVNCLSFEGLEECTTDKQRVERAKADIEATITKLESECDMKPDHVLVFWSFEKNKWAVEISLK